MENNLNELKSMFQDFKNQNGSGKNKTNRENILKKYFVPRNDMETFRCLPPLAGRRHIEEAYFHVVSTIGSGGKIKHGTIVYCPAHNDPKVPKLDEHGNQVLGSNGKPIMIPSPCPLCKKNAELLKKQDKSLIGIKKEDMNSAQLAIKESNDKIYKEANKWSARKFYIIRGIDKGVEKDGVKFWRFKHNFKQQGTMDKLGPVLTNFIDSNQNDFADPERGCDLNITMADAEFNGRRFKQITAITARQPSKLHSDDLVARNWINDQTTWRDVFKPKQAPNMNPVEFMEAILRNENPYWDDSDPNNKKWVFPNRPDLEALANTRTRTFDEENSNFQQASDLNLQTESGKEVNINNVNTADVGKNQDTAIDVGSSVLNEQPQTTYQPEGNVSTTNTSTVDDNDYDDMDDDDLPF